MINNKEEILKNYEAIITAVTDTSKLDREKAEILIERELIFSKMQDYVDVNARTVINQEEYDKNYNIMKERFENIKIKLDEINNKYAQCKVRKSSI